MPATATKTTLTPLTIAELLIRKLQRKTRDQRRSETQQTDTPTRRRRRKSPQ
jgi:hypothetical protein